MAISSKKNRRVGQTKNKETKLNIDVKKDDPYFESLQLESTTTLCRFKRLRYKGCPKIQADGSGEFVKDSCLINKGRDDVIDNIFDFIEEQKKVNRYNIFLVMIKYFQWCDDQNKTVTFDEQAILDYMDFLLEEIDANRMALGTGKAQRLGIKKYLKYQHKYKLIHLLPPFTGRGNKERAETLTDRDYVKIGKEIIKGYLSLANHLINGTKPSICPHFNEQYLIDKGVSKGKINRQRTIAMNRVNPSLGNWHNNLVRHAIMILYMYTGINPAPLFGLKRKDVRSGFKKGVGDFYILDSVKARALYKKQNNEVGFTKQGKLFFEGWLRYSENLLTLNRRVMTDDDPIFPFVDRSSQIRSYGKFQTSPQLEINKALALYDFPKVNSSIYRKTRSDKLYRAVNDTATVAEANNNNIGTTENEYLFGADETHQKRLTSAFTVLFDVTKGKNKKEAIDKHEVHFIDPLSDFDYKARRDLVETPSGSCKKNDATAKYRAQKSKQKFRKYKTKIDRCLDFWSCFQCSSHAIIAEIAEVHKLLSLRDCLLEKIGINSINNTPGSRLLEVKDIIIDILSQLKNDYLDIYIQAENLNKREPHPLWSDENALDDISGVYGW
jgi:hypothetical protein